MAVLRLFPHCDMHLALDNAATKTIDFRIFSLGGLTSPFTLTDVTSTSTAQVLAPHNAVPDRLESFVTIDFAAKTITATKVGTNLVIFRFDDAYIVARIQVHQDVQAWWFGNRSITTVADTVHGHSQPSIYAMFSDDATGTDRVGDITGHGFVTLTPDDPAIFAVMNANKEGRLRGVSVGHATLNGSFIGPDDSIGVDVVDYSMFHDILVPVRAGDLANAADRHNMLFLAEGFTAADEAKFDQIVTEVTNELFSKPRHEPFATLSPSFNVFKAFMPSNDRLITCGFQVADAAVPSLAKGTPIPYEYEITTDKYTVAQLVARVGLPMRGEARNFDGPGGLKALWNGQSLDDFHDNQVDPAVFAAWKNSHALGFLEARDTFFGLIVGARWADNSSRVGPAIATPAADDGSVQLQALVKLAYEFYTLDAARGVGLDGRRHPPDLQLRGNESVANTVMKFVNSLRLKDPPHDQLGSNWVPASGTFKPSRGLIAMIINETMDGGTNMNALTITANNVKRELALDASYVPNANANIKRLRRDEPANINADITSIINTVAHEFGHSFALGDEYEEFIETNTFKQDFLDPADARPNQFDEIYDNIASLEAVFSDPYLGNDSRKIDPNKIKWRALPRIKLSARSTAASQMNAGKLEIAIDPREANAWEAARAASEKVHLRRVVVQPGGQQLPLSTLDADHLSDLNIDSVDVAGGKVVLSSSSPLAPPPNFPAGSSLFIPYRTSGGTVRSIIEEKVFAELASSHDPLNFGPPEKKLNKGPDFPRAISDFKPPCQSSRLIGLFEGAGTWTGLVYRPTGICKMRTSEGTDQDGEFCHVCKWLITQRVDAGKHQEIDRKFYPKAKKNE